MKKSVLFLILLAACGSLVLAQRGEDEVTIGGKEISVNYGRPSLKGRDMLGQLPDGMAWRMGMNDATVLKTTGTLVFGDKEVPPGSYRLWARRTGESWEMMISSSMGNYTDSSAVAIVPLKRSSIDPVETLTIDLDTAGANGGTFTMAWDTLQVSAAFAVK